MHISVSIDNNWHMGAVAFDFSAVLEPHELLQKDMLVFDGTLTTHEGVKRFSEWVKRNIGKRAFVWPSDPLSDLKLLCELFEGAAPGTVGSPSHMCPWNYSQWGDLHTLTWAAQHVLGSEFRAPSLEHTGLERPKPLHLAAINATLIQSALRALVLHERIYGPGKASAPSA